MEISNTEENYLKAIYAISSSNAGAGVSTNQLSAHLKNKAGTITDMLKRLSDKKLIDYQKYKGVALSSKGEKLAIKIIRKHRLWEVFLTQKLKFKWDEVHDIAEQLEHIQSDELVERLDEFLGKPRFDPHGDPIPDAKGQLQQVKSKPLSTFSKKGRFVLVGVLQHSKEFLQYLSSLGLKIGDTILVEEINEFDQSLSVKINNKTSRFFSHKVASNILVEAVK
jgi:DtxR family transcriptional regulator, Mn-dependent transcriptional regulator